MFPNRYWSNYWADRYWPSIGTTPTPTPTPVVHVNRGRGSYVSRAESFHSKLWEQWFLAIKRYFNQPKQADQVLEEAENIAFEYDLFLRELEDEFILGLIDEDEYNRILLSVNDR